ncbi:hypothetical protein KUL113_02340 [Tenacibaculum sp. KUL113]|nr:hypothetical protein KUL113_02340 [Tenacibaculum sp. KUL113]GFD87427.1 hypothetical protein KUL150_34860 [Alteromonas sp. KUL150]
MAGNAMIFSAILGMAEPNLKFKAGEQQCFKEWRIKKFSCALSVYRLNSYNILMVILRVKQII